MGKRKSYNVISVLLTTILILSILTTSALAADKTDSHKKTVRISCGVNDSLYLDDKGKPAGDLAKYVTQLASANNWKLEYVEGSWNESVENLEKGKIDLIFPTQKTDERMSTMAFSDYIGGYQPIALFANEDAKIYYNDFSNFNGKRIGVSKNTSNAILMKEYADKHNFTYKEVDLNSMEDKTKALEENKVDMLVFSTLNQVPNAKIVSTLDYLPFYYATRIDDTKLINEVNSGMKTILDEMPSVASEAYNAVLMGSTPISFTRIEMKTIKKVKKVKVGIYNNNLPMYGKDDNGNIIGVHKDLLDAISKKSGIEIEPVAISNNESWGEKSKDNKVDFIIGSKKSRYNENNISEPIMEYSTVGITRPDYNFNKNESPIFVVPKAREYWEKEIETDYPDSKVIYMENVKDCLVAVENGKADVAVINSWEYNYQSKNERFAALIEWENLRKDNELALIMGENVDPTLAAIMKKSIDQVSSEEKDKIVASNLNMPYTSYTFSDKLYSIKHAIIIIVLLVLLIIVFFLIYQKFRRKYTENLKKAYAELEKSDKAKSEFLSRMSHELRTPLNAINGYATVILQDLVQHRFDEKKTTEDIEAILNAGKYQLAIISDLLDTQKIESGKLELKEFEVDSAGYFVNIVDMVAPEAKEKGIELTYERLSHVRETYLVDGVRLQQVLLNIIHNAVKFTEPGGQVKVTSEVVEQREKENLLKFVISDTGIGMSEDFQKNYLFQRFAQEYKGNTSPYEGCGSGLAVSKEILRLMGGRITCESKKGVGSTFTILLPVKYTSKERKNKVKENKYSTYDLTGIKVLLCEDNEVNQDMERRLLEKMHCTVDIADDGKIGVETFEKSQENYYDVILMDIRMPNIDGIQATKLIRGMTRIDAKTIPIFAVSANSFDENIRESLEAGMNEHIPKPVSGKILYEKINEYCERENNMDDQV